MSIAVDNHNPCNIRSGNPWEGLADPADRKGFANFQSNIWGFRAIFKIYITKYDRGVHSIRALIQEWAPPSENDTETYIKTVCQKTGFGPDESVNLKSWDVASKVCYAQTQVETGDPFEKNFTLAQMAEGALRAGIVDAPKSTVRKVGVVVTGAAAAASSAAPDVINAITTYKPMVENFATIRALFTVATVLFAILAVVNHLRASK